MFKNRAFQVKMVKDESPTFTPITKQVNIDYELIDRKVREYAMKAAIGGVLVYAAIQSINTASTIAINKTKD